MVVSCGGDGGGGGDKKITITFKASLPDNAAYTYAGADPVKVVKINKGTAVGADDFPADLTVADDLTGTVPADVMFLGWYDGTELVTADTIFTTSTTVLGKFGVPITITFGLETNADFDYDDLGDDEKDPLPATKKIAPGSSLGAYLTDLSTPDSVDFIFGGWYDGTTKVSSSTNLYEDTLLKARFVEDPRLKITFTFTDADVPKPDDIIIKLYEGQSFENAGKTLPANTATRDGYIFGWWKYGASNTKVELDTSFTTNTEVTPLWHSKELVVDGDPMEKVWLGNGSFAIYEFELGTNKVEDIIFVSADFKAAAATIYTHGIRCIRTMGPYFYSDTAIKGPENFYYYGDFALDANGAYAAKFDADGKKTFTDFNKFHPYILKQTVNWGGAGWPGVANSIDGNGGETPVGNTWFNVKVGTSGYAWIDADHPNNIQMVLDYIEGDTTNAVMPADIDTTKVYFGFGLPNGNDAQNAKKGWAANIEEHGMTVLVKNVKIHFKDGTTTVVGTVPSFPERSWSADPATTPPTDGSGTTDQVFASYIYKIQYNWRGAADATPVPPKDEDYVAIPDPIAPATAAKEITDATDLALTKYGTGDGVTIATVDGVTTAEVDLTAVAGDGRGFWVALPQDWYSYKTIELYYTADVESEIAKITVKQGAGSFVDYAHETGNSEDSRWRDVKNGDNIYTFRVAGFNDGSPFGYNQGDPAGSEGTSVGISFQINNNAATDVPQKWSFTVTKIILKP